MKIKIIALGKIKEKFLKDGIEEFKKRLIERGDNIQDIELRLSRLEYEEDKIKLSDYVIKNDDFEKTVQVIMTIVRNEKRIEEATQR